MADHFDLIVEGGRVLTPGGLVDADVGMRAGKIAALGSLAGMAADDRLVATGLTVLPGIIDSQVHFREPGNEHKEDLATGTAAAAMGGITAVCEMPNTKPPTTTAEALTEKLDRAKGRAWVDHAFYIGAAPDNLEHAGVLERLPGCAGIKVFMGSSTGTLLVDDDKSLMRLLASGTRRMAVHAEDEARLKQRRAMLAAGDDPGMHPVWRDADTALLATRRILGMARHAGRRLHVLHVSTAAEMDLLADYRDLATVEVTPQHLTLAAPDCYERLGTLAQMNPPIRSAEHRDALWAAISGGVVDVIGSDHAPHTLDEKARPYPDSPSGMTGVQTLVPIMLDHVAAGRLTLERFVDLASAGPARALGIAGKGRIAVGYDGDLTVVDLGQRRRITNAWIVSRCGWTPFDGVTVTGWPIATVVRGRVVMQDGALVGDPAGEPLRFLDCLPAGE